MTSPTNSPALLTVTDLHTDFRDENGNLRPAVNGVGFSIQSGETVALVGESGSGKSMTALSIMRLVPPPGIISSGSIIFKGQDLCTLSDEQIRSIRGRHISMVFQEPMTSLNPVLRVGDQLTEPLLLHRRLSRNEAAAEAIELLGKVGIPSPRERLRDYPHQLSGGMRQRVMIAMALACSPDLLIADEPTTALDVTIQAQILELLDTLRAERHMSILLITHDFGVVAERSDKTCVMYAGRIVEQAPTERLLENPRHPYTRGLLASLPDMCPPGQPLATIAGQPAPASDLPGCDFYNRCPLATTQCQSMTPFLEELEPDHYVRCWKCHE